MLTRIWLASTWFGWNIFYYVNKHNGIKQQHILYINLQYFTCRELDDIVWVPSLTIDFLMILSLPWMIKYTVNILPCTAWVKILIVFLFIWCFNKYILVWYIYLKKGHIKDGKFFWWLIELLTIMFVTLLYCLS